MKFKERLVLIEMFLADIAYYGVLCYAILLCIGPIIFNILENRYGYFEHHLKKLEVESKDAPKTVAS